MPDWTDLDDPVAQRQFDYIRARSLEGAADPDLYGGGGGGEVSISGSELTVRGTLFDALDGLGSAFTADPGDEGFKEITPCSSNTTIENVTPCPSEKEISANVFWALVWHNLSDKHRVTKAKQDPEGKTPIIKMREEQTAHSQIRQPVPAKVPSVPAAPPKPETNHVAIL